VVDQVNLQHRLNFKVDNLSGGELQRVAIARALVNNPTIILADEPTAHLDRKLSVNILDIFAALKAQGKTLILTTHDPLVEDHPMVDHTITMQDGVIVSEEK
jgi:putative ABC transport system ATP-binding protein